MSVTVLVGNPKPRSRTYEAAHIVAECLTGARPDLSIDLTDLGPALQDWSDATVAGLVTTVQGSKLVVAPELLLKPVLVELGATCPTRGLYLLETEYASGEALEQWLQLAWPQVAAAAGGLS